MARSRWTLAGQSAGEGFGAGFNYGMKPGIDRKNSLADLKAKIDQLGQYDPKQLNSLQLKAFGLSPSDMNGDSKYTFPEFQQLSPEDQDLYIRFSKGDRVFAPDSYANASILTWLLGNMRGQGQGNGQPSNQDPDVYVPKGYVYNGTTYYPQSAAEAQQFIDVGAEEVE